MKKLIVLIAICFAALCTTNVSAQSFISGQFGFSRTSVADSDIKTSSFTFMPNYGYSLNEKILVGASLGYTMDSRDNGTTKTTTSMFNIYPYARLYGKVAEKFAIYGEGGIRVGFGNTKYTAAGIDAKTPSSIFGIGIKPGVQYFFTDKWSMNAAYGNLGFSLSTEGEGSGKVKTTNFGLDLNPGTLQFALNYHF